MIFFFQNLITGIMVGFIYAILALGFVVLYKSTGIFNFAQGALVVLGAYVCWSLMLQAGLYIWLSVILTLVICFSLGLLLEYFPIRILAKKVGGHSFVIILSTLMLFVFFTSLVVLVWGGGLANVSSILSIETNNYFEVGDLSGALLVECHLYNTFGYFCYSLSVHKTRSPYESDCQRFENHEVFGR